MTSTSANAQATTLEAILEHLKGSLAAPRAKEAQAFAQTFLGRVPQDELEERSVATWSGLVLNALGFFKQRAAGQPSIRVYNPNLEEHGWESTHTVIEIVNDDMPFLVDSVNMAVAAHEVLVHSVIHPVYSVQRDPGGHVLGFEGEGAGARVESVMHVEVDRQTEAELIGKLESGIRDALSDVRACVTDWAVMRDRMRAIADGLASRKTPHSAESLAESAEFLRWVADDHFTFLGFREYRVAQKDGDEVLMAVETSGLGILRGVERSQAPRSIRSLAARELNAKATDPILLTKTNARSTVHRPGYMDYLSVLVYDEAGNPVGEERFLGLFTSGAYQRRPFDVPMVRRKVEAVMNRSRLRGDSHSGKALKHILETLPRDELFQATEDELFNTVTGVLNLQERQRTRLFVRRDRFGRFFSCMAFLPRDRFDSEVRQRIEGVLKRAFHGERLDSTIHVSESVLARLHLIIRPKPGDTPHYELADLEARIAQIVRNWQDELRDILVQKHGEDRGLKLANRFGKALPAGYIEEVTPWVAAHDVEQIADLRTPEDVRMTLYRPRRKSQGQMRFKLFRFGQTIPLSEALPLLENMGLRVLSEHPYEMNNYGTNVCIQDFDVVADGIDELDLDAVKDRFEAAFERSWRGHAENDGFNRLVLRAQLDWRQVAMLRGYCKYLLQTGLPFSQAYMEATLANYPLIARLLVEYFEAKFDPARDFNNKPAIEAARKALHRTVESLLGDEEAKALPQLVTELVDARGGSREEQIEGTARTIKRLFDNVGSLDEDRILRAFLGVMGATLRTSYWQTPDGRHREYISYKFDSARVPELPKPRPYREIFVYSPRVEGVHLRFGPVARGGLRWSDRREDFRTEVLGLVKAQMVKNTIIVPVGAKGGFVVKRPPVGGDRDAMMAEGVACYRLFINGLLDITDNLVDGAVVHPLNVVRHDADDPYLVVAADKGTATFSDIANAVAESHGFWMGDAFASGGSKGYDHKGMGITARGGWESVKRHFRAMGRDSQSEDFTCVGVGDMSGDVFGNGMLLSRHIRLLAAFDHRHIFLDPNPDAASSFAERERMFALPRSSWADYDTKQISRGGGVYARTLKTIPISPEVRQALSLPEGTTQLSPMELMKAILLAPVDLLWNGGIGTYVKAESETHADVGDRANNALRVNGKDLRCRVIGEGGNLGSTQRGRIEASLHGVLLNTDFIDNSAGVGTSDHEVNIKILLNGAVAAGELQEDARNRLLAEMTDEVAELVLMDNYRQNQAISLMQGLAVNRLGSKQHFIRVLEEQGLLDRQLECLPSDTEFAERRARGQGLTRPELSILLSYSKIVLKNQLLDSDVPEDPYLSKELVRYFPKALQDTYAGHMQNHRLKREIIVTSVINSMVNRMGATFVLRMQEDTGESPAQVAKAYTIAREVLDSRALWAEIEALDKAARINADALVYALMRIWQIVRQLTRWLLNVPGERLDIAKAVERYAPGVAELRAILDSVISDSTRAQFADEQARLEGMGFPPELAARIASLPALASSLDVIEVARERKVPVAVAAHVYYELGEALHLKWLMQKIEELSVEGRWHAAARGTLRDELYLQHRALTQQVLGKVETGKPDGAVEQWLANAGGSLKHTLAMLADMHSLVNMDYPVVSVAVRRVAQLAVSSARS